MKKVFLACACAVLMVLSGCNDQLTSADIESINLDKLDNTELACWEYTISWVQNNKTQSFVGRVWGTEREAVEELKAQLIIYKRSGEISEVKYGKNGAKDEESCDPTDKKK